MALWLGRVGLFARAISALGDKILQEIRISCYAFLSQKLPPAGPASEAVRDEERPVTRMTDVQPGGAGGRRANGARCQARSIARRETDALRNAPAGSIARRKTGVLTDARQIRAHSAARPGTCFFPLHSLVTH